MQVKDIKSEGLSHELEITVPANDIDQRIDARLKEVGKTIRMPGFRPGKVPLAILKKRYGRAVMGEVLEQAVNETSQKALSDKGLQPAMQPKIEVKEFDEGKDLTYSMQVDVLPKFDLMDFKKVKVERKTAEPEDKQVDEALERIAANNKMTVPVESDRKTKAGDTVVFDFHGRTADDNVEHEGMHAHGHHLRLGSGQFIPGFEDQLIGRKKGEKVEVKVIFPENYGAKELAGREAIFDCDINEIREDSEAKIDDDFAKQLGLDDIEALKNAVKEQLQKELDSQSRMVLKKDLLDILDREHQFDVPPNMLEMEHQNIIDQLELERKRNPEQKDKELSASEKAEYKDIAERRVRLGLVLSEIGRQNNIAVSDPELQKAVIGEAQKFPGQEKEVFDYYSKNRQALESLRAPLFEEKVIDYILELAEVKEKKLSAENLAKLFEDDGEEQPKPKKKAVSKSAAEKKEDGAEKEKKPASKKKAAAKKK